VPNGQPVLASQESFISLISTYKHFFRKVTLPDRLPARLLLLLLMLLPLLLLLLLMLLLLLAVAVAVAVAFAFAGADHSMISQVCL
jgi:hypothetical protein